VTATAVSQLYRNAGKRKCYDTERQSCEFTYFSPTPRLAAKFCYLAKPMIKIILSISIETTGTCLVFAKVENLLSDLLI
jgi:hypothetical protein